MKFESNALGARLRGQGIHMPRKRARRGWLRLSGRQLKWQAHWMETIERDGKKLRRHRSRILGEQAAMPRWQAERELERLLAAPAQSTLAWFVRERFWPMLSASWRDSTRETNHYLLERHLLPAFGEKRLDAITGFELQSWLNQLAKSRSGSIVAHCRGFLRRIYEEAQELEMARRNPARRLRLPARPSPARPVLRPEEMARLLEELAGQERQLIELAIVTAMRPSEIFALRWRHLRGGEMMIEERVWRGKIGATKSRCSRRQVWLPQDLALALEARRGQQDGLIFPSKNATPIHRENFVTRSLQPAATRAGLGKVNFQMLRRSLATWAPGLGASVKDLQAQLGHASPQVTAGVYMQPVTESVARMVQRYHEAICTSLRTRPKVEDSAMEILSASRERDLVGAGDGDRTRDIKLGKLAFYR